MTLDVGEPTVIGLLPGDRQQRGVLFKDGFRLPHQIFALGLIELAIDQRVF